jgi:nitronate monooxygenase
VIAAGGIMDHRGAAAALTLGASGIAMGTRFLASSEANISAGYQNHILAASDGGQTTVRTQLYNHLRGTTNWPAPFDARGLINASWRDHVAGMPFEENRQLFAEAAKKGDAGWGNQGRLATYAGTGIGLVREVRSAGEIVESVRNGSVELVKNTAQLLDRWFFTLWFDVFSQLIWLTVYYLSEFNYETDYYYSAMTFSLH